MFKKSFFALGMALLLVGCSDVTAPADPPEFQPGLINTRSLLRTAIRSTTGRISSLTGGILPKNTLKQSKEAPPLVTYDTSFVAVQGEMATLSLHYLDPITGGLGVEFLHLEIPADAQLLRPDGSPAAPGESVQIIVQVDKENFCLHLGPHGSIFANQATKLGMNLIYALDADDPTATPTVWYQPNADEEWQDENTSVERQNNWLHIELRHFSNYAVAW